MRDWAFWLLGAATVAFLWWLRERDWRAKEKLLRSTIERVQFEAQHRH